MCGIAGYIGKQKIEAALLHNTLEFMKNRGPDCQQSSFFVKNDTAIHLLHSRLSILDLDERANQPFTYDGCTLVFNGEIYNYIEVRQELKKLGYSFNTRSDTEVLLKAYMEFGEECVKHFEGMWAFAIWDDRKKKLFLSRDRFSEKPLYIYRDSNGLYFGSEVKFIFALLGDTLDVNYKHLFRYMVNGYKSLYKSKETFFEGIYELPAASVLIIDSNGTETQKSYWQPSFEQDESMTYEQAVEGVRNALIRSVKLRLRADVPLAFCMSGGVDSNSLISIAKRELGYDVHGFTITNDDERYDEGELIDHSIKELGIRHTSIPVNTADFLQHLQDLIRYHDAPVYTISYYAHWLLMQSIAEHGYKISISGTAADELFTGYYDHHSLFLEAVKNDPALFEESLENWNKHIKPIVRNPVLQDPLVFIKNSAERSHIYLDAEFFSSYLKTDFIEEFKEETYIDELLRNRMLNELFHEVIPVILHEDDLNAMYFSIENRSPFLDRHLFEFSLRIPTRHLVRDGMAKSVLRSAMRGIVPDAILDTRRKVGFNANILSFLDLDNADVRTFLLDDSPIFDYVRKDKIESLLDRTNLPNSESKFLFYFLNAKIFLEEYGGM